VKRAMSSRARRRPLSALLRDRQGIAVVEFAFLATFMVFLYLGSQQLADAIFANRKVTTTVRAVTDLTTQYSVLTQNELQMILNSSAKVLSPYSAENAQIRISQISMDENGVATVTWSKGLRIDARETNDEIDIPENLAVPNTALIYGEVFYEYHPKFQDYSVGTLHLSDRIFMSPRVSASVNLS
jgi:Flp pilus assembly protein TadG